MLTFISFGSSHSWAQMAMKLLKSLQNTYPDAKIELYTWRNLSFNDRKYARKYPRGYGYWRWKPFVINEALAKIKEGDWLVYLDARYYHQPLQRVEWIDSLKKDIGNDIVVARSKYIEREWSSGDALNHFGLTPESKEANTNQWAANLVGVKKSTKIIHAIEAWLDLLYSHGAFFRDNASIIPNHKDFKENRHDQTALSLLLKKNNLGLQIKELDLELLRTSSLKPNFTPHPIALHQRIAKKLKSIVAKR